MIILAHSASLNPNTKKVLDPLKMGALNELTVGITTFYSDRYSETIAVTRSRFTFNLRPQERANVGLLESQITSEIRRTIIFYA
jgi:hypothetical protein